MALLPFAIHAFPLKGKITDAKTGQGIPGAALIVPELKIVSICNAEGEFFIAELPGKKLIIQARALGFKTQLKSVNPSEISVINFSLEESVIEGHEVIITGTANTAEHEETSLPVFFMNRDDFRSEPAPNAIDRLSGVPGVSQISSGPGISKPLIRGLGFNRVIIMQNGIRQESQQWGEEHGFEIDDNGIDRVEIVRGPSSLLYGSDALGGVIHFLEPLPAPWNTSGGEFRSVYFSNNQLINSSLMLEGNRKGLVSRLRASFKEAGSYRTPTETVFNSMFRDVNLSGMAGLNKKWGYSHLNFSLFQSMPGMITGERDSAGNFVLEDGSPITNEMLSSRKPFLPFQQVTHGKISSTSRIYLNQGVLTSTFGYQQNLRSEFEEGEDEPALSLSLKTTSGDIRYSFPEKNNREFVLGLGSMLQDNSNRGSEFLIPDYFLSDAGAFFFAKKSWPKATINYGLRADSRNLTSRSLFLDSLGQPSDNTGEQMFPELSRTFFAFTGSFGTTLKISESLIYKANISRGFRAPNPSELFSAGVHEGAQRYEEGNAGLNPEISLQMDQGLLFEGKKFHAEIDFFSNRINNFIYLARDSSRIFVEKEDTLSVFVFRQTRAALQGVEGMIDFHPFDPLHFRTTFSCVFGKNLNPDEPLGWMPAPRIISEFRFDFKSKSKKILEFGSVRLSGDYNFAQNRVMTLEDPSPAYFLLHFSTAFRINAGKQTLKLNLGCSNMLDTEYFPHTSRLSRMGVGGPGRNFHFSLEIPFKLRANKL